MRTFVPSTKEVIATGNDTRRRRYILTINNPGDKWTHDNIKTALDKLHLKYYCMADEIGLKEHTPHTHVYFVAQTSAIRFSTVKSLFPTAHIDPAMGTSAECRDYVQKSGKWADDEKADTSVPGTFEEWGTMPDEPGQGARTDIANVYALITMGFSNAEIMATNPEYAAQISRMDKIRQDILEAKYRDTFRELSVTYIFGPTETGKTRGIMERHGYGSVYRITDYNHPFDRYAQEPVMCFDEFRSSLPIGDMLNYLDGYPLSLPARYANRQACYETVYLVSNIDLKSQYFNVQENEPATWRAFLRRIHKVIEYCANGTTTDHGPALPYIFPPPVPAWVKEAEKAPPIEQDELPL